MRSRVSPVFCGSLALALLLLPLPWVLAAILAATFHEACHLLALFLCRADTVSIRLGSSGAQIHSGNLTPWQGFLCTLAGPLGGAALILTHRLFPRIALCALVQTTFNLIPVRPMDGGRLLSFLLHRFLPEIWANALTDGIGLTVSLLLLFLSIWLGIRLKLYFLPLMGLIVPVQWKKDLANHRKGLYNIKSLSKGERL